MMKKNSKEALIKKLTICMKHFDYKEESKDVKGKQERLETISDLQNSLSDQKQVVSVIIPSLE